MNTDLKSFLLCPIPEDQKPINMYLELKEDQSTNWTTLSNKSYDKKLFSLFFGYFSFVSFFRLLILEPLNYPINFNQLPDNLSLSNWFILTIISSLLCLFLFLVVVFSRWKQLEKDFNNPYVFYEESSWYDGQVWKKPLFILKNDRLISSQRITPIVIRLSRTIFRVLYLTFIFFLLFQI